MASHSSALSEIGPPQLAGGIFIRRAPDTVGSRRGQVLYLGIAARPLSLTSNSPAMSVSRRELGAALAKAIGDPNDLGWRFCGLSRANRP
ncbi:MAG: hypothetical protein K0Q80_1423 [Microvirga sp.]|nr:hypothetical protein [Microvirga sp.]